MVNFRKVPPFMQFIPKYAEYFVVESEKKILTFHFYFRLPIKSNISDQRQIQLTAILLKNEIKIAKEE